MAEGLLGAAGLRAEFERLLSVDDAGVWKPARRAYAYAVEVCRVTPEEMLLVAVHPWDIDGAARAGLVTAWLNRTDSPYPSYFTAPTNRIASLTELAGRLTGRREHQVEDRAAAV